MAPPCMDLLTKLVQVVARAQGERLDAALLCCMYIMLHVFVILIRCEVAEGGSVGLVAMS